MFGFKKTIFMDWKEYKARIQIMDDFLFQQSVRNHNVKMIGGEY